MKDRSEDISQIRALVQTQLFAALSTRQTDGHPYANLVAFWASEDLEQIVFCTLKSTRKFENLAADGRIALLVDNQSNAETDLQQAAAVTVLGSCEEASAERPALAARFLHKHPTMAPFVDSPDCAVMKVNVRSYYLVTRFQKVIELHVGKGEPGDLA